MIASELQTAMLRAAVVSSPEAFQAGFDALAWSTFAGLSTGSGALLAAGLDVGEMTTSALLGFAAGVMLSLSVLDLLLPNISVLGMPVTAVCFFSACVGVECLGRAISRFNLDKHVIGGGAEQGVEDQAVARRRKSAVLTTLALAAHNAPEGLSVGLVSAGGEQKRTALVAVAMALHNVPEGMAVAVAVRRATGDNAWSIIVATCTGLVEPVTAVLSVLALSRWLSPSLLAPVNVVVAGVMTAVSVRDLLPQACEKRPVAGLGGVVCGALGMAISVVLMEPERVALILGAA
eukprot:Hpha_TRINITY_DN8873_c0_g1::TRINITY_DN8873_c0_g1_i1::g.141421::m.141421/K07238/TC.ZIP, zupT, ZRT3, ZIP2; zinc transporter, ZIP family